MARVHYHPEEEAAIERARNVLSHVSSPDSPPNVEVYDRSSEDFKAYASAFFGELVIMPLSMGVNRAIKSVQFFPYEMIYGTAGIALTVAAHEVVVNSTHNSLLAKSAAGLIALATFKSYREKKNTSTR